MSQHTPPLGGTFVFASIALLMRQIKNFLMLFFFPACFARVFFTLRPAAPCFFKNKNQNNFLFCRITFIRSALLLSACILVLSGCVSGIRQDEATLPTKYATEQEEVPPVYTPRDDGLSLSPKELRAFKSKGDLDGNLTEEDAQEVELHYKYFVHQRRDTFTRFVERSSRFLPYIKEIFTARGIPEDIAYLALVESGGNPKAVSPAGAGGLWQFMPFTGQKYGLRQNSWVDERRDPYKSTKAAADYLLKLYNDFADWHLAIAAYNAGEGKIGRAVSGTGASSFFELCRLDGQLEEKARLKEETRVYVPRLLAVAKIMRNLEALDFPHPSPGMAWDLAPMTVPPGTDLTGLARALDLSWAEFSGMNPAFLRSMSPPNANSIAYVPPNRLADAVRWTASGEARVYAGWKEYTVRKGDTLPSVAKRHNVNVAAIREANGITKLPKPGKILLVPSKLAPVISAEQMPGQKAPETRRASPGKYKVKEGDTLYSLAILWGTDVASIRAANKIAPKETALKLGQSLTIPANSKNIPTPGKGKGAKGASLQPSEIKPDKTPLSRPKPDLAASEQEPVSEPSVLVLRSYTAASTPAASSSIPPSSNSNTPTRYTPQTPSHEPFDIPASYSPEKPRVAPQAKRVSVQTSTQTPAPIASDGLPAGYAIRQEALYPPEPAAPPAVQSNKTPAKAKKPRFVRVNPGDSLHRIAKSHATSVAAVRKANNLNGNIALKAGQKLLIP